MNCHTQKLTIPDENEVEKRENCMNCLTQKLTIPGENEVEKKRE